MVEAMELNQIIYGLLAAQIEFGSYHYKDPLPNMEEASKWFSVSLDTVRAAYLQLKRDGYITLTKKSGAFVAVQFQEHEFESHIQQFFSLRRDAVIDLCHSLDPLFSRIQWFAMKNASPETLDELERLCARPETLPPYIMVEHTRLIYGTLNNSLLLRLIWQAILFYQAPFLSLPENMAAFEEGDGPLLNMIDLSRRKDWNGLWNAVASYQNQLTSAIISFYENRIDQEPAGIQITFNWNPYQNSSQRCYSLAMELLKGIRRGRYAQNGFLPSLAKIAEEKKVSVSTVRRTLALLNQLGATRSVNGVGTLALDTGCSADNCDFTQPVIRKRLLDFAQSLQILTLTCNACVESALAAMDAPSVESCKKALEAVKVNQKHESVLFASLEIIPRFSPIHAVRGIYGQLLLILIWGYPLRGMHGSREEINEFYISYLDTLISCLENQNWAGFAATLETLLWHELRFAVARLVELGVNEASRLVIQEQ